MRDVAAAKTCTQWAQRAVRAYAGHLASFEDARARASKVKKKTNMVFYYAQNLYMKIDARDGREWDALLRASARNPATHSNVFASFRSD